ncbi:LRR receptor-like serine threonine-protein kinase [Seminavis robusta]|uniref:LRR receptor-like serine threonine-protein kinase n=1 Tax=Seminavis robusta TaxID=568900 RepID=A0A9N8EKL9_9STRA|nr:LRR receptor-like serine threonine-protein kinase [Seminavis robusta]|eukprot:Sro1119_g243240.1 LRR receptor-like serine threonine-protein kinase (573) ;mRNA; f:26122-27840
MKDQQLLLFTVDNEAAPHQASSRRWIALAAVVVGVTIGIGLCANFVGVKHEFASLTRNQPYEHDDEEDLSELVELELQLSDEFPSVERMLQDGTNNATTSSNATVFVPIIAGLSASTIANIQVPNSAQFLAYEWLLADPNVDTYNLQSLQSRFAMSTLYFATGGDDWAINDKWLSYTDPLCLWYSSLDEEAIPFIFPNIDTPCEDRNTDYLQHLVLTKQNMRGTLPEEIGLLTQLTSIFLSENDLTNRIPTTIWENMTDVIHLSLGKNNLGGEIPTELFSLTNLQRLDLSHNYLAGRIPTEIGKAQKLIALVVEENTLANPIPSELGLLTTLEYFDYGRNARRRRTTLFTEIGLLTNLEYFSLEYSFILQGELPDEFFNLTSLVNLDLKGAGRLNSTLPTLIGQLTNLETLELTQATLWGPLPTELALLTKLVDFNAELNQLTNTIPVEVAGSLSNLKSFLLCNNQLTGSIPEELGGMSLLDDLHLCVNELTGPIPASLGQLTLLTHLDLKGNFLSGQVPDELGQLTAPELKLEIQENSLTGVVPSGVCATGAFVAADCSAEVSCECCVQCF